MAFILWLQPLFLSVEAVITFYNGLQRTLFTDSLSTGCDAAFNTPLNCPDTVQLLIYEEAAVGWDIAGLSAICDPSCVADLNTLVTNMATSCAADTFYMDGTLFSLADLSDTISDRLKLICSTQGSPPEFCLEVEKTWDIGALVMDGTVQWPTWTLKCHLQWDDTHGFYWAMDENGKCIDPTPWEDMQPSYQNYHYASDAFGAYDIYYNRSSEMPTDNGHGWPDLIYEDEYPLQIQCQPCFASLFLAKYEPKGAPAWTEMPEQIWRNMVKNCGIMRIPNPYRNAVFDFPADFGEREPRDLTDCPNVVSVPAGDSASPPIDCNSFAAAHDFPTAGVRRLNPELPCHDLRGQTVCSPVTCTRLVVGQQISARAFASSTALSTIGHGRCLNPSIDSECTNLEVGSDYCIHPVSSPTTSSLPPTSTTTTTSPTSTPTSICTDGTGPGGYLGLCDYSCHYDFCPSPCTCTSTTSDTPNTPPAVVAGPGYALVGQPADFGPLCDFACSRGYCPAGVCTTAYSPTPEPGLVCVQGEGEGGYAGLCGFCCMYGYCPPGPCVCSLYGPQIEEPPVTGAPGVPVEGLDGSYEGLCSYACNHGYCPDTACEIP
ncbi:hypothetical protein F5144DRAFT_619439 [Chaetomium tenue]|uniref:Uncharacterized protein n=1 Tax=Chaetomium tenue TaxID=1854479 RepID=A0ACB7PEZ8_9PEZI|nr:hypothetical protein F5144DRAFT_619439 [Chaetomium globosum]